jgi:hypothetical protein
MNDHVCQCRDCGKKFDRYQKVYDHKGRDVGMYDKQKGETYFLPENDLRPCFR